MLGRRWNWRGLGILFPLLFDIDGYLKRYVGGLVVYSTRIDAYRPSRETDDLGVSFTVCRLTQVRTMNRKYLTSVK